MSETAFREKYEHRIKEIEHGHVDAFIAEMMADPLIDYGSVCLALGYAAAAAAWSANRHPTNGGITGFQSGFVLWEFIRQWDSSRVGKVGARLINYDDLLFPQMGDRFDKTLSPEQFDELKKLAQANLDGNTEFTSSFVIAHWQSIVAGTVPHGFTIKAD